MGMYSSFPDGNLTDFHLMHHGHFAFRGAALTIVEVTAVTPNGRSSPSDAGLWHDSQIPSYKRVVDFIHSLETPAGGQARIGIQLGHAGRKASMMPIYPGHPVVRAEKADGGWPHEVWGASPIPFKENYITPKEMTVDDIQEVVKAFGAAAKRAVEAGFDFIEIHAAHGYLISSFLSPISNTRTDAYGGSFDNRVRFLVSVVREIRANIPNTTPFSVRISAVDWMAHSPSTPQWTLPDSISLALLLADEGVDVLDVSSGGNNVEQVIPKDDALYQVNLAKEIKTALQKHGKSMFVAAVGRIADAATAQKVVSEKQADLTFVATEFLRDPNLVHRWAEELGASVEWPRQYVRADRQARAKMGTL
ncbi:NADH-dependent flavin oxidoreductase [Didymosphaeria variabile]|uniref:NADH-dependent flavin oxidoreductase n=1 Tax=Didymosphaeria variabile TaxID=1932322 RepID=A0A9W8XLL4_9PLEO|nr:NADH-dependent flavin oxidoreductase [Didymosphaeria variabile]KAJ4354175.1 NADH-dependent flavin oxidoreductase [Didymosphaeria variabile]